MASNDADNAGETGARQELAGDALHAAAFGERTPVDPLAAPLTRGDALAMLDAFAEHMRTEGRVRISPSRPGDVATAAASDTAIALATAALETAHTMRRTWERDSTNDHTT